MRNKEMLDIDIHIGLSEKEIRDFFSKTLTDFECQKIQLKQPLHSYNSKTSIEYCAEEIENSKKDIQFHQEKIKILENIKALVTLLKDKGWIEHDCSDYVIKSYKDKLHLNFIGTEEEFKTFMKTNFNVKI